MPTGEPPLGPAPSIFISYASQDRETARKLRDAFTAAGFDVWYDESELGGGDAWDQKIRRQIRECRYFMPVISSNANARHEGYFRREWRLAVERTQDMADDVTFIIPVTIDSTSQSMARVPDKFLSVQWHSIPGGVPTPAFDAWCRRLLGLEVPASPMPSAPPFVAPRAVPLATPPPISGQPQVHYPKFPDQDPARKLHFIFLVIGWALKTAWVWYQTLPKRGKKLVVFIIVFLFLARLCSDKDHPKEASLEQKAKARQELAELSQKLGGAAQPKAVETDLNKVGTDLAKVGSEIAAVVGKELADEADGSPDILAVPFDAPATDEASSKFAGEVFSSAFGKLTIAFPKKVALGKVPAPGEPFDPVKLAKERGAARVLFGAIHEGAGGPTLDITLESAADSKILWAQSFQTKDADSSDIADEIRDHVRGA